MENAYFQTRVILFAEITILMKTDKYMYLGVVSYLVMWAHWRKVTNTIKQIKQMFNKIYLMDWFWVIS